MERNRKLYSLLVCITIIFGLISRSSIVPKIIYPYIGDYLYTIMCFFIFGFFLRKKEPFIIALISILFCYLIEILQLCQLHWINSIRSYKIGGLILGHGFLWSDIICYTLGGITGYIFESIYYKRTEI